VNAAKYLLCDFLILLGEHLGKCGFLHKLGVFRRYGGQRDLRNLALYQWRRRNSLLRSSSGQGRYASVLWQWLAWFDHGRRVGDASWPSTYRLSLNLRLAGNHWLYCCISRPQSTLGCILSRHRSRRLNARCARLSCVWSGSCCLYDRRLRNGRLLRNRSTLLVIWHPVVEPIVVQHAELRNQGSRRATQPANSKL